MKKVMFIIVGMLFAVTVNAASLSLNLTNTVGSATINPSSGQWVSAAQPNIGNAGIADEFELEVVGRATRVWFDGDLTPTSAESSFELFDSSDNLLKGLYVAATDSFAFNLMMDVGTYTIKVVTTRGYHFSAETPIPAALFLFAPALLGFFGLRRKAAVAA